MAADRDELAKAVADLEARLKEPVPGLRSSSYELPKRRRPTRSLRKSYFYTRRMSWSSMRNGFKRSSNKPFFAKDLDFGLFDPFKDVKDGVLLDDEDIAAEEEAADKG